MFGHHEGAAVQTVPYLSSPRRRIRTGFVTATGEEVERPARPVTVHSFELQRSSADMQDMYFRISCSKGTYIRSLAHDLVRFLLD